MDTEKYYSINQLSRIYGLPDITLYRDFRKLRAQGRGAEGKDFIKYYKNPQLNKFEWRINPLWFERSVDRKLASVSPSPTPVFNDSFERSDSNRDELRTKNHPGQSSSSITSWLMQKVDELTEMLKNSQILIAQQGKQIEALQKKVLGLEPPDRMGQKTSIHIADQPIEYAPKKENFAYKHPVVTEKKQRPPEEIFLSNEDLEKIIDDDGNIVTSEELHHHDTDIDPWIAEDTTPVPDNPNVRGGETDPRALDSDLEPIQPPPSDEDGDVFSRIAQDRGY